MKPFTQTFLSTLAQISVTAIVLLVSGIIAFSAYQQERKLLLTDEISKERLNISTAVNNIKHQWGLWSEAFVPVDFEMQYKKLYKNANHSPIYIWDQALHGINFDELGDIRFETRLIKALKACDSDFTKQINWGYPLRVFFISKLVNILSRTDQWQPTKPKNIFPITAIELGYIEWEKDFEEIIQTKHIVARLIKGDEKSELIKGLKLYLSTKHSPVYIKKYTKNIVECVNNFLSTLDQINEAVQKVEEKTYILKQSHTNKINSKWLILCASIGLVIGVIMPLVLINQNVNISATKGYCVFFITLICIIFSFCIFFQNVTSTKRPKEHDYIIALRYKPLAEVLKSHSGFIGEYNKINLSFIYDFINCTNKENIPKEIIDQLNVYLNLAEEYNSITQYFWEQIQLKLTGKFSFVKSPPFNTGYSHVSKSIWFDKEKRYSISMRAIKGKETLGFTTVSSLWTQDLVYLPFGQYSGTFDDFIAKLDIVATEIADSLKNKDYFNIRKTLSEKKTILIKNLSSKLINSR